VFELFDRSRILLCAYAGYILTFLAMVTYLPAMSLWLPHLLGML